MIVALDVHYDDKSRAAAVVFEDWPDAKPVSEYIAEIDDVEEYIPGEFYKRELPCLLAVLGQVKEPISTLIIDGYVNLGDKPGLGMHLWDSIGQMYPVIGVAKSRFHGAKPVEVLRGLSKEPLYITAVGIDEEEAANSIKKLHGEFRIPTLLKKVDKMSRGD